MNETRGVVASRTLLAPIAIFALGTAFGMVAIIVAANAWPQNRVVPTFYSANHLTFGVASNGRPALCDEDNQAYTPNINNYSTGLAFVSEERNHVITALKCVWASPPPSVP
jgi:hypothetical protein